MFSCLNNLEVKQNDSKEDFTGKCNDVKICESKSMKNIGLSSETVASNDILGRLKKLAA